jgi:hypothetical protein
MKVTGTHNTETAVAFTPGLKIKKEVIISKTRRLPILGEVLVQKGDQVVADQIVARSLGEGEAVIVRVADLLGLDPSELSTVLLKNQGDPVKKGEVIAKINILWGLIKKSVEAPIDGTIDSISKYTGAMIIRGPSQTIELNAYIPGKIVDILPDEGVVIETNAALVQGIFGIGGETHGELRIAVNSADEELKADMISTDDTGKILVGGALIKADALRKAADLGVNGIVIGGMGVDDVTNLLNREIGVAITGREEVGFTLIITEGFGTMTMSDRAFNLFKRFAGHQVAINGTTQIRAGVQRPEVVIPHETLGLDDETTIDIEGGIAIGTQVRVIREPHFGDLGTVISLPVELQKIETESSMRVLEVTLQRGERITVPRANVEIIEE